MVSMLIEEYSAMDLMASQCRGDSVASNTQQVCSAKPAGDTSSTAQLLILPAEMLRHILSFMGAKELVTLAATCKSLGARASPRQHSYCEAAAMDQYQGSLTHYGLQDGPCMEER